MPVANEARVRRADTWPPLALEITGSASENAATTHQKSVSCCFYSKSRTTVRAKLKAADA